ncbi:MAG TPA: hypothetical protein PLA65_15960 [Spirochaetota bacterium]|nr:hypothetical protein [Spirochaetota bacterium]HOD13683.1 hypothetical protein [Spirochaetota bacterium]HPG50624.1 hypothetical protein [Spirochaetota bacterium]HPN13553.1 hypothetical protein [Spirochaetota bacterium]
MGLFGKKSRKKIIIVIHGLSNKPEKQLLEKWCRASIREGLRTIDKRGLPFALKLVYWADLMHEHPQSPRETNKRSDTYLDDPYLPGDPDRYAAFTPSTLKRTLLDKLEKKIDKLFFDEGSFINFEKFASIVVRNLFKDLDLYYHRDCPVTRFRGQLARDAIRMRLAEVLRTYSDRSILLISHSMGTIISYDVLTQTTPDVKIDTLVTIGSPLGMPLILKKILIEQGRDIRKERQPVTPENIVTAWYNFSDLDDPVAINYNLADDYKPNRAGIASRDIIVYNNYENDGDRSPHKLYGYLRAPEVSNVIYNFCVTGRPAFMVAVRRGIGRLFGW